MAYEYTEKSKSMEKPHGLTLEDRKNLKVKGVEAVESFDESEVVLLTAGSSLIIKGSSLRMGALDPESGEAAVSGLISELRYEEVAPSGSLWTRLFH